MNLKPTDVSGLAGAPLSVTIRGCLGPDGIRDLVTTGRSPGTDTALRRRLIATVNRGGFHDVATDAGIRYDAQPHPARFYRGLITWGQVWAIVAPGITAGRVAEFTAAYAAAGPRFRRGEYDDRAWAALCAFFAPVPSSASVQLELFEAVAA